MNWLYYLLEANLYLTMFYAVYLLLLCNETFYTANRWYLLSTCIISFVLPVTQIGWLKPAEAVTEISFTNANLSFAPTGGITDLQPAPASTPIEWTDVVLIVYALGTGLAIITFVIKLVKLYYIVKKSPQVNFKAYKLIEIDEQNTGFSFFNYLFIGKNQADKHTIITHEMVHIRQNHSADIIFIELLKVINWFNPLIYLLQNSLKTLHEYIADEYTATKETDNLTYSSFLLNNAYGLQGPAAANSFFNNNLLKNRIVMLNKPRSGSAARLKYLIILPAITVMLGLSTLTFSKDYKTFDLLAKQSTAIIDPQTPKTEVHLADTGFKFPPPDVVKNDFSGLTEYLSKHIKYPENALKNDVVAGIVISFDVNSAGATNNAKILGKVRGDMEVASLKAIKSYSGKLKVKPGTYTVGINFAVFSKKYIPFARPSITKKENFVGTVTIMGSKQKQKLKEQSVSAVKISNPSAQIPEPNIERISFKNTDDTDLRAFNKHLSQHIAYPKTDYNNRITGRVFAQITTDQEDKIKDVKVLRAPSKTLEDEVVRAIKSYQGKLPPAKSDHADYIVPISFNLADNDGNMLVEKSTSDTKTQQLTVQENNPGRINTTGKISYSLNEVAITAYLPKN